MSTVNHDCATLIQIAMLYGSPEHTLEPLAILTNITQERGLTFAQLKLQWELALKQVCALKECPGRQESNFLKDRETGTFCGESIGRLNISACCDTSTSTPNVTHQYNHTFVGVNFQWICHICMQHALLNAETLHEIQVNKALYPIPAP